MEFEQPITTNLFDGLGEFEHSLSSEEDPFAPIRDLDDLFADDAASKQIVSSIQPRPLQEMMGAGALGGIDSLTKNIFKTSSSSTNLLLDNSKSVVEDVLSEVMNDLSVPYTESFQASCNDCAKPLDLPSAAMSLISSAEALLADDILAEIPRAEFECTTTTTSGSSKRDRIESIDCSHLFDYEVGNDSIASIVKSIDEAIEASPTQTNNNNKRPSVVTSSCARPTKKSKVEQHMAEFDDLESSSRTSESTDDDTRFRNYQTEKWMTKFDELIAFKKANGHCQVPHSYKENLSLGRWAKRQRYQYKLYKEGKPSTMCEERIAALEELGFVWDSHSALWEERYKELLEFYVAFGHSNVPSSFPPNAKLAIWVKCQRRQRKLLIAGQPSNMTLTRVERLNKLNFVWEVRRVGI